MNQRLFLLSICLFLSSLTFAQNSLTGQDQQTLIATINLIQNEFEITKQGSQQGDLILKYSVALENGELVFNYMLPKLGENEFYQTNIILDLNDRPLVPKRDDFIGAIGDKVTPPGENMNKVILTNLIQNYINLVGDLKLTLSVKRFAPQPLLYGVTCDEIPQFTIKQKLPYIYAGIAGGLSIGAGQLFRIKGNQDFEAYEQIDDFTAAEPHYQDYEKNAGAAEAFTYAGIALLVVDVVGYTFRSIRHKKRVEVYNEYCNPQDRLTLQPFTIITEDQQLSIGLKLGYTF